MIGEPLGANTGRELKVATSILNDTNYKTYFITIKPTFNSEKKRCTNNPERLMDILMTILVKCEWELIDSAFEYDKKELPHIHVIVKSSLYPSFQKGYHVYIDELKKEQNITKVADYISKDRIDLSQYAFQME